MKKKITVTQGDIETGIPNLPLDCPISLAMRKRGLEYCVIKVFAHRRFGFGPDKIRLPVKAQSFIKRFDAGKKVKPFSFEVEL